MTFFKVGVHSVIIYLLFAVVPTGSPGSGPSVPPLGDALDGLSVGSGNAYGLGLVVVVVLDGELDFLALHEGLAGSGGAGDGGLVDEDVLAAVEGGEEAEALGDVEPFDLPDLLALGDGDALGPLMRRAEWGEGRDGMG